MLKKIVRKVFSNKTLFYPGCLNRSVTKDISQNYQEILKKLGVEFIMIDELGCSGGPLLDAGYKEEFEATKEKNLELFDKYGVSKIIVASPSSLKVLKQDYRLEESGIEVIHVYELLTKKIDKIKDIFKKGGAPKVTFHDSCYLGRYCGIYDGPRKLIIAAGYGLEEFPKKREHADCCGVCGGVRANFPQLAGDMAKKLLKGCKTPIIVACSPGCYLHLKENAGDIEVKEISHLIRGAI
ncbi:(Fe-S)-binding protein [Nanoarchaeota archaeon]